jgi:hypothetical protein
MSPGEWDPDIKNDDDDDATWFDAVYDDNADALDDETFYETRDEWFNVDNHSATTSQDSVTTVQIHALNSAKLCLNGLSKMKLPIDYESFCPFLGWKPVEVIRHTLASTTQYAKYVMCLPIH